MIRTGRKTAFFFAMLFLSFATPEVSSSLSRTDKREILSFISSSSKKNGTLGIVVRAADTGETVFRYNSEKSFIPASNNKILSSVAALSLLGKDFRFRTEFYLGGGIHGNVAHGGLYVKGFGDPTIDLEKLELIAKRIKNLGVNRIDGGILLDGSYFDETYYGEGWDPEWVGEAFCPPVAAISFNYNSAKIKVSASRAGMPAYVSAEPKEFPFAIKSRVLTSRRRSGVMAEFGSRNQIRLSGYVSSRRKRETLEMSVPDPFFYFGEMLRATLEKKGVRVDGRVRRARVPKWAGAVFTHYSEPLGVVIREYNKESVNIIGESLVKVLGARFMKEPGSWKTGTYVIRDYLAGVGVSGDVSVVDGSGLSRMNRVSPGDLAEVLLRAYKNPEISKEFLESLPVAGVDGTLEKRFYELKGRVYAKTGYLEGARSLSGYVFARDGRTYVFSIISNGMGARVKKLQSLLLRELVN